MKSSEALRAARKLIKNKTRWYLCHAIEDVHGERIAELENKVKHLTAMLDNAEKECEALRGCQSGACGHASDCAVHNEPAYPAGPCSCGFIEPAPQEEPLHVGDSRFESWYSNYSSATLVAGTKQVARDAYAAGMSDPLVTPVCAPALPDVVKAMAKWLLDSDFGAMQERAAQAADMLERLAANRVPEGMVLVPKEPTEAMLVAVWSMLACVDKGPITIYKAMIAAG